MKVDSRARNGIRDRMAAAALSERGWARVAPFGRPVVPLVRMTHGSRRLRPRRRGVIPGVDQRQEAWPLITAAGLAVGPGHKPALRRVDARHDLGELLVVDHGLHAFTPADLGGLRAREVGVQVQDPGARLQHAVAGVEHAPMVAAQDAHAITRSETTGAQGIAHDVGAAIHLGVGQAAELVDQPRPATVADTGDGEQRPHGAIAVDRLVHGA